MRVALIISMKYGLTQFMFRDIKALIDKGHKVSLFTLLNNKGLYNPLPEWHVIPLLWWRVIWTQLWFFVRHPTLYLQLLSTAVQTNSLVNLAIAVSFIDHMRDIDIIFAYFGDHKFFTGYYCKRITGTPLVVTIRAYELHNNPNSKIFAEALNFCDRIVTISEYNKNFLIKHFNVPASQIEVIRQIIDFDIFKYEFKVKVLIVGFFSQKKGHEILFKALKQLNRDDIEVWVVGDEAPDRIVVDCRQLARDLGVTSQIAFFGVQKGNALRALYRECDIFCLPSRTDCYGDQEGFPNVIAEAMAFGKPVISTRHAGIPEVLDSILVEENNVEQLAEALNLACDSVELRLQLGKKNRAVVEKLFSPTNNDKLEKILLRYSNHLSKANTQLSNPQNQPHLRN